MSRKCKFDQEWEQALMLLSEEDAVKARQVIENYQKTGVVPSELPPQMEMILLLVKPLIDRRHRATEAARRRRLRQLASVSASEVAETVAPLSRERSERISVVDPVFARTQGRRMGSRLRW